MLYGSVARAADGPDSDVDVLVVSDASRSDLRDGLDAFAFDLTLEFRRAVAFILYPAAYDVARAHGSEFLLAVEREEEAALRPPCVPSSGSRSRGHTRQGSPALRRACTGRRVQGRGCRRPASLRRAERRR